MNRFARIKWPLEQFAKSNGRKFLRATLPHPGPLPLGEGDSFAIAFNYQPLDSPGKSLGLQNAFNGCFLSQRERAGVRILPTNSSRFEPLNRNADFSRQHIGKFEPLPDKSGVPQRGFRGRENGAPNTNKHRGTFASVFALAMLFAAGCGKPGDGTETSSPKPDASSAPAHTDWPIFRGDPALSGVAKGELSVPLSLSWTFKTGGPVQSSAVVVDGRVFFGSGDSNVYAVDLVSGEKVWSFPAGDVVEAPPLALNGAIYVGNAAGLLHAIDATSGQLKWSYQTGDKILASANWFVWGERTNLLIGSYDYFLHCADAATGASNWVYETENYLNGTPAVADGRAVFGGCDAVLHVVDVRDGAKRGEIPAGAYVAASVAVADGKAFYGHYENEFQCVDLRSGKTVWTFRDRNFPYFSSAAIAGDRVLFGGRDKRLHCVNRDDGARVWQFATRGKVDSSPVVCGDKVIVGSDDGRVYVVSLNDGTELWSYEIGEPVGTTPAVASGRVIVGSEDGNVYCFSSAVGVGTH